MEVREVREARPVTIETISSSWVMALCGNGGMLVLTGVKAIGRGTCMDNTVNNLTKHTALYRSIQLWSFCPGFILVMSNSRTQLKVKRKLSISI